MCILKRIWCHFVKKWNGGKTEGEKENLGIVIAVQGKSKMHLKSGGDKWLDVGELCRRY